MDMDSELETMSTRQHDHEPEDRGEEKDTYNQERSRRDNGKDRYDDDSTGSSEFLPGTFPDDVDMMTGGLESMLPSPEMMPEPNDHRPRLVSPKVTRT